MRNFRMLGYLVLLELCIAAQVEAQGGDLFVSFAHSRAASAFDDSLKSDLNSLREQINRSGGSLTGIHEVEITYPTPCSQITRRTIATLTPAKYVACKSELGDKIIALRILRRADRPLPYYSAVFVTSARSNIRSLTDSSIKRLLLIDPLSSSGGVSPIFKLWEMGVIDAPSVEAVRRKGWTVDVEGQLPASVRETAEGDPTAVAATAEYNPDSTRNLRVLLRYDLLPQDVLVVSADLGHHAQLIGAWFDNAFAVDSSGQARNSVGRHFAHSASKITGFDTLQLEHYNAFGELRRRLELIQSPSSAPMKKNLPGENELPTISLKDFASYLGELSMGAWVAIIGSLATLGGLLFGGGYWCGKNAKA